MKINKQIEKIFRAKKKRRLELAKLPFEKKIDILIELQKMAYGIPSIRRKHEFGPWKIVKPQNAK